MVDFPGPREQIRDHSPIPATLHVWIARLFYLLVFLTLWILMLRFPYRVASTELDPSWEQSLGYFWKHQRQAGADYIFTYGPLGSFCTKGYNPELYSTHITWQLVINCCAAWIFLLFIRAQPTRLSRLLCLVTALLFFHQAGWDLLALITLFSGSLLILLGEQRARMLVPYVLYMSLMSLAKFTITTASVCIWITLLFYLIWHKRYRPCWYLGLFPILYVTGWTCAGQDLRNLPTYFLYSLEITRGYNEAMNVIGLKYLPLAALTFVMSAVCFLLSYPTEIILRRQSLFGLALVALMVGLAWKISFVRQGVGHAQVIFDVLVFTPFAVLALLGGGMSLGRVRAFLLIGTVVLVWGYKLDLGITYDRVHQGLPEEFQGEPDLFNRLARLRLSDLLPWRQARETCSALKHYRRQQRKLQRQWDDIAHRPPYPRLENMIGSATVDMLGCEQGWLVVRGLNFQPRPIFQSYSAYTPALAEANARFYQGERAPEFVLWKPFPIDFRPVACEDSPTLRAVLRRYYPVMIENDCLLLRRRPAAETVDEDAPMTLWDQEAAFDEPISLQLEPGYYHSLVMHIEPSWKGTILSKMFRLPYIYLKVQTARGREIQYRLVPALAETGLPLDSLLEDGRERLRLFQEEGTDWIRSVHVLVDPRHAVFYQPTFRVALRREGRRHAPTETTWGCTVRRLREVEANASGLEESEIVSELSPSCWRYVLPQSSFVRALRLKYRLTTSAGEGCNLEVHWRDGGHTASANQERVSRNYLVSSPEGRTLTVLILDDLDEVRLQPDTSSACLEILSAEAIGDFE
ncbi:MAG: hypothetical protein ACK4RK_02820 [Gemmataceae bacterium]